MRITIDMPRVSACDAARCAYNADGTCHARAITVGDSDHAACDTFVRARPHVRTRSLAGVGACKATSCRYNVDYECEAEAIRVAGHEAHADCVTFTPR
jgi:hypothetical protein